MTAHRAIESVTLDKETMHKKDEVMPKYAELIYNGYWYSKARFKLQKIVDLKRNKVNGSVKLKLYKGNITIISRQTKSIAYSMKKVSFEENKTFNKSNVEKFINFHKKKFLTKKYKKWVVIIRINLKESNSRIYFPTLKTIASSFLNPYLSSIIFKSNGWFHDWL